MELQDELRSKGLEQVCEEYKLDHQFHPDYPELVLVKYRQIESDFNILPVRQARGTIFNKANNWEIIAWSYNKFKNWAEPTADKVDFDTAIVAEKQDGSLIRLFYYDNKWHCASSGTPSGSGQVNDLNITFSELFWQIWNKLEYKLPDIEDKDLTFSLELCSLANKVVCEHPTARIVLHGIRNRITGQEMAPEPFTTKYGWECVKTYPIKSLEEMIRIANERDPFQHEGFVATNRLVDGEWLRVKIKSDLYVFWAHVRDGMGTRKMLEIIRKGESIEFLCHWRSWQSLHDSINAKYQELVTYLEEAWNKLRDYPRDNRKEWALQAVQYRHAPCLFSLLDNKVSSVKEYLSKINIKSLEQSLGLKSIEFKIE